MRKTLLISLSVVGIAGAIQTQKDWHLTVSPSLTYINYSNSNIKRSGFSATLYGALTLKYYGTHVFEAAIGNTHLDYKNSNSNWNQSDYVIAYTNYQYLPWYGKVGFHYISSPNNDFSSTSQIYFADIGYIKRYAWNSGVFVAYSNYRDDIDAVQAQAHGGFYRWIDFYRGYYFSGSFTWINVDYPSNTTYAISKLTKNNYFSVGASATYFTPKYSLTAGGWVGERVLDVDAGGFVVYNLSEKYYWGLNVSGTYYLNRRFSLNGIVGYSQYKELASGNNVGVLTTTVSLSYSF